jgi:hypothetical protein
MRKFIFLLFASALAFSIHAQQPAKKRTTWGYKAGINISRLNTDGPTTMDNKWKTGFATGLYVNIPAGARFSVQPEFLYSSMGGDMEQFSSSTGYRLNYFSIPLLAKFNLVKGLSFVAGPQADILIVAKTLTTSGTFKTTGNYKDYSFNITGGLEFWPCKGFGLSARYMHGLDNISDISTAEMKNQGVQLMAALKF